MKNLIELLKVSTRQLASDLNTNALECNKGLWWAGGNLKSNVCLVAHIDTVWRENHKTKILFDNVNNILTGTCGLGADDRAGVYVIESIMKVFRCKPLHEQPMWLLTNYEETGGIGANAASDFLRDTQVDCLVELDRRGSNDMVFYHSCDELELFMRKHSTFMPAAGIFSDITVLTQNTGIQSVNLSIGYYNEHTVYEYLNITEMLNTKDRVLKLIPLLMQQRFPKLTEPYRFMQKIDIKEQRNYEYFI